MLHNDDINKIRNIDVTTLKDNKVENRKKDLLISDNDKKIFTEIFNEYLKSNPEMPKIIHQTWIGPNKRPDIWIDTWKNDYIKDNPDWKHMLWTDNELNEMNMFNKDVYNNEPSYNGKSDIARYEILFQYGGIYIDADSIWLGSKSMNDLIDKVKNNNTHFFLGQEPWQNYPASGVVGSSKHNPSLLLIIKAIEKNSKYRNLYLPWITCGPLVLHVTENNKIPRTVFPKEYFYPEYWHRKMFITITDEMREKYKKNSYMYQFGYTTNGLNQLI